MSNAEHLIENAICSIERNEPKEYFMEDYYNIDMAKALNIDLEVVYEMAMYVVCTIVK